MNKEKKKKVLIFRRSNNMRKNINKFYAKIDNK